MKQIGALPGSTGNNTHGQVEIPADAVDVAFLFTVEAVGATPTVTYKWQYSLEGMDVTDANSTWYDSDYVVPGTAETVVNTTRARTAVGSDVIWPLVGVANRSFRKARLVTTLNTNVTYRGEVICK